MKKILFILGMYVLGVLYFAVINANVYAKWNISQFSKIIRVIDIYSDQKEKKVEKTLLNTVEDSNVKSRSILGKKKENYKLAKKETLRTVPSMYHMSLKDLRNKKKICHIIAKKETLHSIAELYKVDIDNLRKWNYIKGNKIYKGYRLVVFIDK